MEHDFSPSVAWERSGIETPETAAVVAREILRDFQNNFFWDPAIPLTEKHRAIPLYNRLSKLATLCIQQEQVCAIDPMTGLYNRGSFLAQFAETIQNTWRNKPSVLKASGIALIMIDLDKFKDINDFYGHRTGDQVIIEVAGRIKNAIRPYDRAHRYGGDEFVVTLSNIEDKDIPRRIEYLQAEIARDIALEDGNNINIRSSFGYNHISPLKVRSLALMEPDKRFTEMINILNTADSNMYQQKKSKRTK